MVLDLTRRTTPGHRLPLVPLLSSCVPSVASGIAERGGARGGLNKLFCRLPLPLVFCLQSYKFFLKPPNIYAIILLKSINNTSHNRDSPHCEIICNTSYPFIRILSILSLIFLFLFYDTPLYPWHTILVYTCIHKYNSKSD